MRRNYFTRPSSDPKDAPLSVRAEQYGIAAGAILVLVFLLVPLVLM